MCLSMEPDVDLRNVIQDLNRLLINWDRETLLMLTEWTNLEWTDSPEMEGYLRSIIQDLVRELEQIIARPPGPIR